MSKNIIRKTIFIVIVALPISIMADTSEGVKIWEGVKMREDDLYRHEEVEDSYSRRIINKLIARTRGKSSKGKGSKINNTEKFTGSGEFLPGGNLKDVLDKNYPGLFDIGTLPVSPHIAAHDALTNKYSAKFGVDPALMRALMSQESYGGQAKHPGKPAWGPAQIEYTLGNASGGGEFGRFGEEYFGRKFRITKDVKTDDRGNLEYNIAFGCYRFRQTLDHYDGDYAKALQAYNFSHYSLDKLLKAFPEGNRWLDKRGDMALYNGWLKTKGLRSYGDKTYIENVLRYYNP